MKQLEEVPHSHHRDARRRRERARNWKSIWKNSDRKLPFLVKEIDMQVQEAQRVPNKIDAKKPTRRCIVIKMPKVKDKERILKAAREKQLVTYRGVPIRLSADFSKETLQARRHLQEIFKVMKARLLYPAKLSFRIEGQIKSSPDKKKLKELLITKPLLSEMLKGLI